MTVGETIVLSPKAFDHEFPVRVAAEHGHLIEMVRAVPEDFEGLVDAQSGGAVHR
jgi:hypothetical protein